jgi:hypothetical protein
MDPIGWKKKLLQLIIVPHNTLIQYSNYENAAEVASRASHLKVHIWNEKPG